tara:strand:- start:166 stop:417 length:252 start_codon:yes stop_codon:yes gene_type:complete
LGDFGPKEGGFTFGGGDFGDSFTGEIVTVLKGFCLLNLELGLYPDGNRDGDGFLVTVLGGAVIAKDFSEGLFAPLFLGVAELG